MTGINGAGLVLFLAFIASLLWVGHVAWREWMDAVYGPLPIATFDREAADRTVYGPGDFGAQEDS